MPRHTPSLWEYIAEQCKQNGYIHSAAHAATIEKALHEMYESTTTNAWVVDYGFSSLIRDHILTCKEIEKVARNHYYCIACTKAKAAIPDPRDHPCNYCDFGRIYGICLHKPSLFNTFITTLVKEGKRASLKTVFLHLIPPPFRKRRTKGDNRNVPQEEDKRKGVISLWGFVR